MTGISTNPKHWNVGLVGYGEVGRILAEDLRRQDVRVTAYDLKLGNQQAGTLRDHAATHGVALAASMPISPRKPISLFPPSRRARPYRSRRPARRR
jgi:lactate dehydrogenase-like 2-hydroxyacid dehydrogenase